MHTYIYVSICVIDNNGCHMCGHYNSAMIVVVESRIIVVDNDKIVQSKLF